MRPRAFAAVRALVDAPALIITTAGNTRDETISADRERQRDGMN